MLAAQIEPPATRHPARCSGAVAGADAATAAAERSDDQSIELRHRPIVELDEGRYDAALSGYRQLQRATPDSPAVSEEFLNWLGLEITLLSERAEIYTAASVAEALEHLDEQTIDVIVSDLHLGDGDGLSLIRAVRQRTDHNRFAAAIATTGYASNEDRSKTLEAGFATHLSKPYDVESLVRMIATFAPSAKDSCRLRSTS